MTKPQITYYIQRQVATELGWKPAEHSSIYEICSADNLRYALIERKHFRRSNTKTYITTSRVITTNSSKDVIQHVIDRMQRRAVKCTGAKS